MKIGGWLYLIRNGDLYKIGITKNIKKRMYQLQPDYIVAKLYINEFKQLEKELHKKYKSVRVPQTEYFRLNSLQVKDIKKRISCLYYPKNLNLIILLNSTLFTLLIFSLLLTLLEFFIKDIHITFLVSLLIMEKFTYLLSFYSLFIRSNKYLSFLNELKFRIIRSLCFVLIGIVIRFYLN